MRTKILDLIKTDHILLKQWMYGISDARFIPIVSRINAPEDNKKKVVIIMPDFLKKNGIETSNRNVMVMVIKGKQIVTQFFCNHPNYLFKKEKESEFQIIY